MEKYYLSTKYYESTKGEAKLVYIYKKSTTNYTNWDPSGRFVNSIEI